MWRHNHHKYGRSSTNETKSAVFGHIRRAANDVMTDVIVERCASKIQHDVADGHAHFDEQRRQIVESRRKCTKNAPPGQRPCQCACTDASTAWPALLHEQGHPGHATIVLQRCQAICSCRAVLLSVPCHALRTWSRLKIQVLYEKCSCFSLKTYKD